MEDSACCIWATWFQVVLRGFLITQFWTQVSPSLTKQQESNSFLNGLDNLPHHQPYDQEPFCHTEAILNELIRVCGERSYLDLPQAFGAREEEGRLLSSAADISHIFPIQRVFFKDLIQTTWNKKQYIRIGSLGLITKTWAHIPAWAHASLGKFFRDFRLSFLCIGYLILFAP